MAAFLVRTGPLIWSGYAVPLRCIFFSFLLLVLCEVSATDGFFSGSELLNKAPVNFCEVRPCRAEHNYRLIQIVLVTSTRPVSDDMRTGRWNQTVVHNNAPISPRPWLYLHTNFALLLYQYTHRSSFKPLIEGHLLQDGWRATRHGCEYTWRAGRSGLGWRDSLWLLLERLGLHHRGQDCQRHLA